MHLDALSPAGAEAECIVMEECQPPTRRPEFRPPPLGPRAHSRPAREECETQPHRVEILVVCPPSPEPASSAPCDSDKTGWPERNVAEEAAEVQTAEAEAAVEAEEEAEEAGEARTPLRQSSAPSRPAPQARPRAPHPRPHPHPQPNAHPFPNPNPTLTLTLRYSPSLPPTSRPPALPA